MSPIASDRPTAVSDGPDGGPKPYLGGSRGVVVEQILSAVEARHAVIVLTGVAGVGKSTILNHVVSELGHRGLSVIRPGETAMPSPDVARVGKPGAVGQLRTRSGDGPVRPVRLVLVQDDAQALSDADIIRLIGMTRDKVPVCLAGDETLWPRIEALAADTVAVQDIMHLSLRPLKPQELPDFIALMLKRSAEGLHRTIAGPAMDAVYRASEGVPARVEPVISAAVAIAYCRGQDHLALEIIDDALASLAPPRLIPSWVPGDLQAVAALASPPRVDGSAIASATARRAVPVVDPEPRHALATVPQPRHPRGRRYRRLVWAGLSILVIFAVVLSVPEPPEDDTVRLPAMATGVSDPPDGTVQPILETVGDGVIERHIHEAETGPIQTDVRKTQAADRPTMDQASSATSVPAVAPPVPEMVGGGPVLESAAEPSPLTDAAPKVAPSTGSHDGAVVAESTVTPVVEPARPSIAATAPEAGGQAVGDAAATTVDVPAVPPMAAVVLEADLPVVAETTAAADEDAAVPSTVAATPDPPANADRLEVRESESAESAPASAPAPAASKLAPTDAMAPATTQQAPPVVTGQAVSPSSVAPTASGNPRDRQGATQPTIARLPPDVLDGLLTRGQQALRDRDILSARLLFERAGSAGSATGAVQAGKTYDPAFLSSVTAVGLTGDPERAAAWYRRAAELGGGGEVDELLRALPVHSTQ